MASQKRTSRKRMFITSLITLFTPATRENGVSNFLCEAHSDLIVQFFIQQSFRKRWGHPRRQMRNQKLKLMRVRTNLCCEDLSDLINFDSACRRDGSMFGFEEEGRRSLVSNNLPMYRFHVRQLL